MCFARLDGDSLAVDLGSLCFSISLSGIVSFDTLSESLTGLRLADVFNSDVNSLGHNSTSNALVDNNTDGVLGHIEDLSSLSMVEFVGHTLLDGTISDDINVFSLVVAGEELVEGSDSVLAERL